METGNINANEHEYTAGSIISKGFCSIEIDIEASNLDVDEFTLILEVSNKGMKLIEENEGIKPRIGVTTVTAAVFDINSVVSVTIRHIQGIIIQTGSSSKNSNLLAIIFDNPEC